MKMSHAVIAVAAICTTFSLKSLPAVAQAPAFGARAGHVGLFGYAPHFQFRATRPPRTFRARPWSRSLRWGWPAGWYGGVVVLPHAPAPPVMTQPTAPVPVKSCRYLKQTVTVPAEAGGTAQVTVTRC